MLYLIKTYKMRVIKIPLNFLTMFLREFINMFLRWLFYMYIEMITVCRKINYKNVKAAFPFKFENIFY